MIDNSLKKNKVFQYKKWHAVLSAAMVVFALSVSNVGSAYAISSSNLPKVVDFTANTGIRVKGPMVNWQTSNGIHNMKYLAGQSPDNDLFVIRWQDNSKDWRLVNVSTITGKKISGPVTSWQKTVGQYNVDYLAAQSLDNDLIFFWRQGDGIEWHTGNVTNITGKKIASPVTSWQTPNGPYNVDHLAGSSPENDLLVFWWQADDKDWRSVNVTNITGKKIVGPVTSWQTPNGPYNVEHLAGQSPDNELLVFWWQGDGKDWRSVNVTNITGKKIAGPVVSWQSSNDQYNLESLAGPSPDNDLLVFSWQPDGKDWRTINVSSITGKKIVGPVTFYQVEDGDEKVEVLSARGTNNELLHFWRTPSLGWQVMDVTESTNRKIASTDENWTFPNGTVMADTTCNDHLLLFSDFSDYRFMIDAISKPFQGLKRLRNVKRKVLTILWDPHRPDHLAPEREVIESLLYGSSNSVQDYFMENSNNKFTIENVGVLGWYDADKPADHYWGAGDKGDKDGDGWVSGHTEKWAEAIRKASMDFDFSQYDLNNDGILSTDELGVLIVIPQKSGSGTNRPVVGRQWPQREPLIVDGVQVPVMAEAYIINQTPAHVGVTAHELSHLLLHHGDMYFTFFQPYAAGAYSLMDQHYRIPHFDPFSKLKFGWVQANLIVNSGEYKLTDVETRNTVWILANPERGLSEYFILENRWPGTSYDKSLPDHGLAIWHIIEDPNVYRNLPAPPNSDLDKWNKVGQGDWARRSIRMIREHGVKPPFKDNSALWDDQSAPAILKWADGTPSGFSVDYVSAADSTITVDITSPLDDGQWKKEPSTCMDILSPVSLTGNRGDSQFFTMHVPEHSQELDFDMFDGLGDADMYIKSGLSPSLKDWDFRPYLNGNDESVFVSAPKPGPWNIMIHGYDNFENISLKTFPFGLSVSEISAKKDTDQLFTMTVPDDIESLKIEMYGGQGDADMYIKRGMQPTLDDWDYRPYKWKNNETVHISNPEPGEWYIGIHAYEDYQNVRLKVLR